MRVLKSTITRGEVTPLAAARQDIEFYQAAAARLTNWFVLREGGIRRRSGTRYRGAAKSSSPSAIPRLIPFVFSASQAYVIELGNVYARFWTNGGIVESGGSPYEISSPYAQADLPSVQYIQSGDTIYLAFRSMTQKPQKLVRTGPTSWSFSNVTFKDGPYFPLNDVDNAVTPNVAPATGSTSTLTFGSTANINGGSGFQTTDVGRLIRVQFEGKWSWGTITTRTSTTVVVVTWSDGQGGTTPSRSWRLGAFSDTTGYPGSVAIVDGRLVWASTPTSPRYIGYSYSGLPETYTPSDVDGTVTDAHGGAFDLVAGDEILWLQDAPKLQIGTPRGIFSLGANDIDQPFGPRNARAKQEIAEGVSAVRPVVVGASTVHCGRFSKSINDLFFDYQVNALVRPELSTTAEHLFDAGIKELHFQQIPHRRLWSLRNDGQMICTTLDRYEKVIGFSRHYVGGNIQSASVIPGSTHDELWLVVRRTINGNGVTYIETLDPDFLRGDIEDAFFGDCGGTYSGTATNTVSGITWLANTEVAVIADGKVLPNQTVSGSGVLTLPNDRTATKISFGVPILTQAQLLPIPLQVSDGSVLGRKLKVISAEVDVYETKGLRVTSGNGKSDILVERPASRTSDADLDTGAFRVLIDSDWLGGGTIGFAMDKPLPATVRAVNLHVVTE